MTRTITLEYDFEPKPRWGYDLPAHPQLTAIIEANRATIEGTLAATQAHRDYFATIKPHEASDSAAPYWHNGWFPALDAVVLTSILADTKPRQLFEVGSGNSTKFARAAISHFSLPTKILSIDPCPRAEINALCDETVRSGLENVDLTVFDRLEPEDILFVDNSHQALQNTDVTVFFTEVLPRLKPGVLIQIHDIYLPWDYVDSWAERYYNEQYLLACWLLAAPQRFDIVATNFYTLVNEELKSHVRPLWTLPCLADVPISGGSFWFRLRN